MSKCTLASVLVPALPGCTSLTAVSPRQFLAATPPFGRSGRPDPIAAGNLRLADAGEPGATRRDMAL